MQRARLLLLLIVVVGALLRIATVSERSFWLDEMTSIQVSSEPAAVIATGEAFDNHTPPLYYLLLHLWWWLAPKNELGLRLPSLLVDLLNIALVWRVFSRQFSRRVGLSAAVIFAVSEYAVYYSQDGRMYSLVCFLGLATYALALDVRAGRDLPKTWFLLLVVGVAGMYTHYFYALVLVALTVVVTVDLRSESKRLIRWYAVMGGVGLAFLPWVRVVLELAGQGGQPFRRFVVLVFPYTLFRWTAGYAVFPLNYGAKDDVLSSVLANLPAVALYLGVFGALAVVGVRRLLSSHRREAVMLLTPLFLPALVGLLISLSSPMLSERYLIVSYPFFVALLALAAVDNGGSGPVRVVQAAGAVLLLLALAQHYLSPAFGNTQWRQSVAHVRGAGLPSATVYAYPSWSREVVVAYAAPDLEVRPLSDAELERLLAAPDDPAVDRRPAQFWLLERGNVATVSDDLGRAGYTIRHQTLFPLRNGVRVFYLERSEAGRSSRVVVEPTVDGT
jgi:uncharacterized membrane protein